jgi:diguanylate cyclase (GGDEF)-like protein
MNPPVLPVSTGLFSLSTISLMIAITFLMQGSAIAFSAVMVKAYQGVRTAFLATVALGLSFVVLLLQPPVPGLRGMLGGTFSNLLFISGYFLNYLAICQFVGVSPQRWLVYFVVPAGVVMMLGTLLFPPGMMPPLTVFGHALSFLLNVSSAVTLYRSDHSRYRLAAILTALPLFIYGLFSMVRVIIGFVARNAVLPGQNLSNVVDILALYLLSYLWTAGFILMVSQRLHSDLNDLAMNDALTRVRNRRAMQSMLDFEMRRVQQEVKDFSIILLDVDHFKRINDTYGHDAGDLVLQWMAHSLQAAVRAQDIVARWGGEEFLVLLPDTNLDEAIETADRLRQLVEESTVQGVATSLHITFSAGVSNSKTNRDVTQLCKVADQALYIAKQTRNRVASQDEIPITEPA